jgi:hypothetical protein
MHIGFPELLFRKRFEMSLFVLYFFKTSLLFNKFSGILVSKGKDDVSSTPSK